MERQGFNEVTGYKSHVTGHTRVFVGLSGGVDSSVSSALLQKAGYNVTGVFIKIWQPEWTECTMKDDRLDAMRVCAHLGIPFKEIDLTEEYKRDVVDYMIAEYAAGRTPNPDVACNKNVKFGSFFDWAIENGADCIATGHYAQIVKQKAQDGERFMLRTSHDTNKDQTYFLWTLTQKQLARTLFPVGNLEKKEVRRLAERFGLPTSGKKDSQGLCFVGHVDIKEFLSRYVPQKRGDVLNAQGEVIGYHDGAHFLTIGERHGFTITARNNAEGTQTHADSKPQYIISKDIKNNTVTAAPKTESYDISYDSVILSQANWIGGIVPDAHKTYEAQIRYHGMRYRCFVKGNLVTFSDLPQAIALGQSLVIYDRDICIGGGIMERLGV
jgi:tRNA-specific 2-thiouridylase